VNYSQQNVASLKLTEISFQIGRNHGRAFCVMGVPMHNDI